MNRNFLTAPVLLSGLIIVVSVLALALAFSDSLSPLRGPLVFLFVMLCPGLAFVRLLRFGEPIVELVLAISLSMAIGMSVALILLYLHLWSFETGLIILAGITFAGLMLPGSLARHPAAAQGGQE